MNQAVQDVIARLKRENTDVQATHAALRARMSEDAADVEVAKALTGCLWEQTRGMPDRWQAVLKGLREGKAAEELFPDALYDSGRPPRWGDN